MRENLEPGLYRHFKGGMYQLLYLAQNSEDSQLLVIYRSMEDGKIWSRPVRMWVEEVEVDGKKVPRFERVKHLGVIPGIHTITLDLSQPPREGEKEEAGRLFFPSVEVLGVSCHVEFLEVEYFDSNGQVNPAGEGTQEAANEYWRSYLNEIDQAFNSSGAFHHVGFNDRRYVFFIYPGSQ